MNLGRQTRHEWGASLLDRVARAAGQPGHPREHGALAMASPRVRDRRPALLRLEIRPQCAQTLLCLREQHRDSWSIVLDLGYQADPKTGLIKRRQKWHTVRGTRKDAENRLTDLLKAVKDGQTWMPRRSHSENGSASGSPLRSHGSGQAQSPGSRPSSRTTCSQRRSPPPIAIRPPTSTTSHGGRATSHRRHNGTPGPPMSLVSFFGLQRPLVRSQRRSTPGARFRRPQGGIVRIAMGESRPGRRQDADCSSASW